MDFLPDRDDFAGQIAAHDKRKREREGHRSGANVGVDRIDGAGPDAHERLAWPRDRIGKAADLDHVRGTCAGDEGGLHRPSTFRVEKRTPRPPAKAARAPTAAAVRRPLRRVWY